MSNNIAIVVQKPGESAAVEASVPTLRDDYILVRVKAVALNPTDWKHVDVCTYPQLSFLDIPGASTHKTSLMIASRIRSSLLKTELIITKVAL